MTDVKLALRGLRGESFADVARRVGSFGSLAVPAGSSDADVLDLLEDRVAELVAAGGFSLIAPARAATTANITLSGAQTIDGVAVVAGDRVLVKNQTTAADNGIYVAAVGAWARATDFDATSEVVKGSYVIVTSGTTLGSSAWVLSTADPITVGTTAQSWILFRDFSAANVNFTPTGSGAVPLPVETLLRQLPISTTQWGITADSNGTTGNGTDWTTQLQALVTYARANGRDIFVPAKPGFFIRFTATINFAGAQTKMEVIGESNFDSAFFADFTSVSNIAAFSNNASSGARSYVSWRNFRLQGRSDTDATNKVRGIYSNWGGEFSRFEDVFVFYFYDSFVVANDYYVRFDRCLAWFARNDGYTIGRDLSGATAACNNLSFNACHGTNCAQNGLYVYACRALSINGGAYEANSGANVFLDLVYGGSITGLYNEYGPLESGNPAAQLRFRNCNGCTVNGFSASAFDNGGLPVIYVDEGCYGIILNGVAIETAGADTSAVGVLVRASFGVEVNGGYFDGMTTGIRLTEGSRVTISSSNIMAGTPVSSDSGANVLTWNNAIDAQVTASVASINANTATDIVRTTLAKNVIGSVKLSPQATGTHLNLASAAQIIAINAELLSESYRITNIFVAVVDAFAGGGGNRDLVIRDSTTVYTTIPAASLQTLNAKGSWGDAVVPFGTGSTLVTATQAGLDLYMQYSGGTTDYTTGGVIVVYVEATRIA